jgi:transcriptional regulator with GAF, ATPase, and Fis domain
MPGREPTIELLQGKLNRYQRFLAAFSSLLAVAGQSDPIPGLKDIAAQLLQADEVDIVVPAGLAYAPQGVAHYLERPVPIGGRPLGSLRAWRSYAFDEDDLAMATCIGQIAGDVFERAALQSRVDEQQYAAQAYAATCDQLLAFGQYLNSSASTPLQAAIELAIRVPEMVGADRASLLLLGLDGKDEPLLILSNGNLASTTRAMMVRDQGLAGLVLREKRSLIIDQTDTDQRWLALNAQDSGSPTRCAMAVPLNWAGNPLGVLTVTTTRSNVFGTSHLGLLELAGSYVALALRHAEMHNAWRNYSRHVATLQAQIDTALDQARLHMQAGDFAQLAATLDQIREANARFSALVGYLRRAVGEVS